MSDNDKRIRFEVLQTAIGLVDQDLFWRKENGESVIAPSTDVYIKKANELMAFVDDMPDSTVKTVTQLLTEHAGK
jgi:hypothetical protein